MLNRFKNKLANIVGGISNPPTKENGPGSVSPTSETTPFPYSRPSFLQLSADEIYVSADHVSRPILVPRSKTSLPWSTGYAEVVNAGKTKVNEDQAASEVFDLPRKCKLQSVSSAGEPQAASNQNEDPIKVHYFGMFDGHAGTGAGLMAVNLLHFILQDKLMEVQHLVEAQLLGFLPNRAGFTQPPSEPETPSPPSPPSVTTINYKPTSGSLPSPSPPAPPAATATNNKPTSGSLPSPSHTNSSHLSSPTEASPKQTLSSPTTTSPTETSPVLTPTADNGNYDGANSTGTVNDAPDLNSPAEKAEDNSTEASKSAANSNSEKDTEVKADTQNSENPVSVVEKPVARVMTASRSGFMLSLDKFNVFNLITGALEAAFFDMDLVIGKEKRVYKVPGGCTAVVALFFEGKLYVANAGDSRAIISRKSEMIPMSFDFTPETDRERIQLMAWHHAELLCNMFSSIQFAHRVTKKDIGKRVIYRNGWRKGWSYKTVEEDDVKMPLIYGEGKKARLLGTIGVSRGFGDHDLRVYESDVFVKPFMSCVPEVRQYDLTEDLSADDVLIMATDGLWDVTSNEKASGIVQTCLAQFKPDDPNRYVSAAQELVMYARGVLKGGWRLAEDRLASGDDISAFVIPLNRHSPSLPKPQPCVSPSRSPGVRTEPIVVSPSYSPAGSTEPLSSGASPSSHLTPRVVQSGDSESNSGSQTKD